MTTIPPTTPAIAFIGTGRMGAPMAANLARGGFGVRVWNRTASRAATLAQDGAAIAGSPAEAVKSAGIVITMLADGPATEHAATGPDGFLAPVFGALGRATDWLGPAGHGTRAKLVLNSWLADLTEATAETLAFARQLGLDPAAIMDLLQSTPLGSPYAAQKASIMLAGDFTPAFALKHALKDAELAAVAAQASGAELTLTRALLPRWRRAAADGHAEDDLAAIYATT
jgi:3-hydroxyisobutyrate dehydrogenase